MRTFVTRAQLSAIIALAFEDDVGFMQYQIDPDGTLTGVIVDHAREAELPDASDWED